MRKRWVGAAAALAAATMTATASASDVRVGTQADPAGDATFAVADSGPPNAAQLLDIAAVRVTFNADTGALRVDFDGDLNGVGHSGLSLRVGLSAPGTSGRCTTTNSGDYVVTAFEAGRYYSGSPPTATLSTSAGTVVAAGVYADEDQTGTGPRLTFGASDLAGQDLRCVTGVSATKSESGFQSSSRDDVDPFCLGTCPMIRAPELTLSGDALTWQKVAYFKSYVVATSTAPEGSPGRTTTYQTVMGTSLTPAVVQGQTRYYSVRVDVDGALWSTPEVAVSYPIPATPGGGTAPGGAGAVSSPVTAIAPGGAGAPSSPVTATEDLRDAPAPFRLGLATARVAAAKALAARFTTSFRRRSAGGYRLSCTARRAKASCVVQWRYRGAQYRGTLTLAGRKAGTRTSVWVTRVAVRKR